ncbi:uncharacterized protein LOC120355407 [Nilaparvata lugens]|uniref:uncharacterized protein LOC120355407 n=1 Tax=Nilaparvata lugens TaxID=108931 RepID=UPI00193DAE5A|nr:uncharacterized protein LOC120355407 [Nilaparvata lugens]
MLNCRPSLWELRPISARYSPAKHRKSQTQQWWWNQTRRALTGQDFVRTQPCIATVSCIGRAPCWPAWLCSAPLCCSSAFATSIGHLAPVRPSSYHKQFHQNNHY